MELIAKLTSNFPVSWVFFIMSMTVFTRSSIAGSKSPMEEFTTGLACSGFLAHGGSGGFSHGGTVALSALFVVAGATGGPVRVGWFCFPPLIFLTSLT